MSERRKAVFLDRDGTLMEEVHYCGDPAMVKVYAGVPEALRKFKDAGFVTCIVTNQSGIGRGLITEAQYHAVQRELLRQIGANLIDAQYYCPDQPEVPSLRRKPQPGMLCEAAADLGLDLARSVIIGDKYADIQCGCRAGTRTVLVLTGYGREVLQSFSPGQTCKPDLVAEDLASAVPLVLEL